MEATREETFFFRDREVLHISPELRWDYFHVAVPIPAVVVCIQSDQIFKGLPIFLRFRSYKWIHKLTR